MEISGLGSAIGVRRFLLAVLFLVLQTADAANTTSSSGGVSGRKLLIGGGDKCRTSDLVVNHGLTTKLPHGIPTYNVEIHNQCSSGCNIAKIHMHCGSFSSETFVNPFLFRRVNYDECVVNDGKPIAYGGVISFQYATTSHPYPLSVAAFTCF